MPAAALSTAPTPSITQPQRLDRKSTRLNSSHTVISYAVFCLKKKENENDAQRDAMLVVLLQRDQQAGGCAAPDRLRQPRRPERLRVVSRAGARQGRESDVARS